MKVVQHHRSALSRQVGEAVRIRRRGLTLNSRGEFNRCSIPRLTLGLEEENLAEHPDSQGEEYEDDRDDWTDLMLLHRDEADRLSREALGRAGITESCKRVGEEQSAPAMKRRKKQKYELLSEDWGMTGDDGHTNFLFSGLEGVRRSCASKDPISTSGKQDLVIKPSKSSVKKSEKSKILEKLARENHKILDWTVWLSKEPLSYEEKTDVVPE